MNRNDFELIIYGLSQQWRRAEAAFEAMRAAGLLQPDVATYNPLVNVLWQCGKRRRALRRVQEGVAAGVYPAHQLERIDLHDTSPGAATALLICWLAIIEQQVRARLPSRRAPKWMSTGE
jgi:hypothetical protein